MSTASPPRSFITSSATPTTSLTRWARSPPNSATIPTRRRADAPTLPEIIRLVDAGDGVRFGALLAALCLDPDITERALADLLDTAATLPDQPADNASAELDRHLTRWEPVIAAVAAAASTGHTPTELHDHLDELGATTDWAALVAALRRVLTGDRDRGQLLVGLDDIDAAILTALFDRLPTDDERPG